MLIGHDDRVEVDIFMYARNAGIATEYCKEIYKEKKYNSYQAIKVGLSHTLVDTQILQKDEADQLRQAGGDRGEKYSEREIETPRFVTKQEAEEMGL